jgi:hypothetical protein
MGQSEQQVTPQDQDVLRFWTVLTPTLLRPAIEFTMEGWNPLDATEHGFAASKSIIDSFFFDELSQITNSSQKVGRGRRNRQSNHDDVRYLCESLICQMLIPKLKNTLESTKWNPLTQTDIALDVYEYLHQKCLHFDQDKDSVVADTIHNLNDDDCHVLPSMGVDETTQHGHQQSFLVGAIHEDLILDIVYPKLQAAVSNRDQQDWTGLGLVLELHARSLLSDVELLSVVESDILCPWARSMYQILVSSSTPIDLNRVVEIYRKWKIRILVGVEGKSFLQASYPLPHSVSMVRGDVMICQFFNSVLSMIQLSMIALEGTSTTTTATTGARNELEALGPYRLGYRNVVARRWLEAKQKVQEDSV